MIDARIGRVRACYETWLSSFIDGVEGRSLTGSLDDAFSALLPLTIAKNRTLLLPMVSGWTAVFRNGIQGSDPASAMPPLAAEMDCRAMRICCSPPGARHRAVIWEVYDPAATRGQASPLRRSIAAANDGGRWVFEQFGAPYPFERPERYAAPRKRDRFDRDLLLEYLAAVGIGAIGDAMFEAGDDLEGELMSHPPWKGAKSYGLEEVCAGIPWQR